MSLDLIDVKRIANLAQLELSESQASDTLSKLNGIFSLVEQLKAVDTTGITPLSHPIAALMPELCLRLRDDVVTDGDVRDKVLANAPDAQHGFFAVPKVIE